MTGPFLLDTCAILWMAHNEPLSQSAQETLSQAGQVLHVSPISAWEIGMLVAKNRITFTRPVQVWFDEMMRISNNKYTPLSASILIESSQLPGQIHADPADRIIIATARAQGLTIVTRDRAILNYAALGHVAALPC